MTDPTRTLAEFTADLVYDDLPDTTRDHLGLVVADTVGAIVGGNTLPEVAALADLESDSNPGEATILGTDRTAAPGHAALVNATGGTSLELDEGHKYAAGHPAIHVFPAVLAEAEVEGGASEDMLAALVAGYEVGTRVGRACTPLDQTYHMHGLWGTVGTAAGVARYRNLDAETTTQALRMAASHALHTRFETALEGATVRNTYAGASNLAGIAVVNQAEAGFTGLDDGIERHLARVSKNFDAAALTDRLDDLWEVERGYFKQHAACRYTHPTLDAVGVLTEGRDVDPDDVESVTVETYETAAQLTSTRPHNPLEAKFSIPFAVATMLTHGHSHKEAFTEEAFDEVVFDLAERVSVTDAPDLSERVPDKRSARVTVTLASGESLTQEIEQAAGGAEDPFEPADLREKFGWLVEPTLDAKQADTLWDHALTPAETTPNTLCYLAIPK
jgi:2-methylcitrate dehydratase PrpD